MQNINRPFKPEKKISSKQGVDLRDRVKIPIFLTEWLTSGKDLDFRLAAKVDR